MKKTSIMIALALALVTVLSVIPATAALLEEPISDYDDYGYYAYFDFENYGAASSHNKYFRGEYYEGGTVTKNADGKESDPFGFLMNGQGNSNGSGKVTTVDGNTYYTYTQNATDSNYDALAVFAFQSSINGKNYIIGDAAELSFKFRMSETQTMAEGKTTPVIHIRRGSKSSNSAHILADGKGNLYARINGSNKLVYTNSGDGKFMDIVFTWYDVSNTYTLSVNGKKVVEGIPLDVDYRNGDYVAKTFDDDFFLASKTLIGTSLGNDRALELFRGTNGCKFVFDIDDIKLKRAETAQRGAVYYENSFDASYGDGLSSRITRSNSYFLNDCTADNFYLSDADENGNKYLNFSSGSYFSLKDSLYHTYLNESFVIEAKIKAKPTHTEGMKSLIAIINNPNNWMGAFYVDPDGNLYIDDTTPTLVGKYKLDGTQWLDITVVAIKNLDNKGKFGSFSGESRTSSSNCFYSFAYYINGEYVGASKDRTFYEWKFDLDTLRGTTSSNAPITVTRHEEALDVTGLTKVADGVKASTSTANHIIYKSADGKTYYDVTCDADGTIQPGYSAMALGSGGTIVTELRFFAGDVFEGAIDDIRVYSGTAPEWYYTSINSEKGGEIINANFAALGVSGSNVTVQTSTATDPDVLGIFRSSSFTANRIVRKDKNGAAVTTSNVADADYVTLTLKKGSQASGGDWFDFFIPVPNEKNGALEAEYSFETTIKNVNITPGTTEYSGLLHLFRQRIEDEYVENGATKVKAYSSGALFCIDSDLRLWGGDYQAANKDERFKLCDKDGNQIVLDNSNWNSIRCDVYCYKVGSASKFTLSYYYNGEPLYLEDGTMACDIADRRVTATFEDHWGQANHRVRFSQAIGMDTTVLDIKSIGINANSIEKPIYEAASNELPDIGGKVSVIDLEIPEYTGEKVEGYYGVIAVDKLDKSTNILRSDYIVFADARTGELAAGVNGGYYKLCDKDGNVYTTGASPVKVAAVYNDITGKVRYYIAEAPAYVLIDGEVKLAVDLDTFTDGFNSVSGAHVDTTVSCFAGHSEDEALIDASAYKVSAYTVNDLDTAELIGFQENDVSEGIRLVAGVDTLYYSSVGFEVEIYENGALVKKEDVSGYEVFDSILEGEKTITAADKGYKYLATLNISDLPTDVPENSFIVVTSYTEVGGVRYADTKTKILVTNDGCSFGEITDKDIYKKKQAVLLIGQSNMAGRGDLATVEPISDQRITMMRASGDSYVWVPMVEPIHTDKTIAGAGIAASFAKAFVETFDQELGLIPAAVGGTSLAQWTKGYSGDSDFDLYEKAIAKAKAAQKDSEICAILWHQGCSNQSTADYDVRLKKILDDFITDLGLDSDKIVIVTGELARAKGDNAVNRTLPNLVDDYARYAVASSEGLITLDENTHFDAPSLRVFGYRYFAHFYRLITGKTYSFVDDIEHYRITPEVEEPEPDTTTYVANVDFNNLPAGTKDAPTTYVSKTTIGNLDIIPGNSTASVQVFPHSYDDTTDKYIAVNSVSGSTPPFVDIATDYAKGSVIVTEFRMRLGDNFAISGPLVKFVQNSSQTSTHLIRINSDGTLANAVNGTTTSAVLKTPAGADVMVDKFEWTVVKIVADLANNTKDIYIDGVLCLENAKIKANASDASGFKVDLTRLSQLDPNATGTVYIDDFKSYRGMIVNEGFSGFAVGNITTATQGKWFFSTSQTNTPIEVVQEGDGNKCLAVYSKVAANNSGYIDVTNDSEAGRTLTVEARIKIGKYDGNNFASCGDLLKLLDPSAKTIALVRLDPDGTLRNFTYTSGSVAVGESLGVKLSETEWTTVKVVCDMANNKKDIYINGELVLDDAQLYVNSGSSAYVTAITRIIQPKNSGKGIVYIDDYKFYN